MLGLMNPTFDYEKKLWKRGLRFVGGADEVGRGAFAGPVVAAVVVFDPLNCVWPDKLIIRDSKKMNSKQRELSSVWLKENTYWGVGEVGVNIINKDGIGSAARAAFRKAVSELHYHLPKKLEHLLLDAFYVPYLAGLKRIYQTPIIHGDELSFSIAAASIIAKVHRDSIMRELSHKREYRKYKWGKNAGYGTAEHRSAILSFGTTHHHRTKFAATFLSKVEPSA
jgi:ribonuclease HII